ncbi:MAG: RNA methyltransferase [Bacteroidales bacterium]|nr:RNA methyltransferase [Bacteroidales bacterium]MCM1146307.1 RNA methyltransferase [Bacteroidales bacterium]MCM1205255.1 RNA methyltransferase [Bacillota bacterium]
MRKLKTMEMQRISVEEFHEAEKMPLIVVLDDVRSMHNVGSVFRTCDAFRAEGIYLCGITATPPQNEIHKTALGAEESVAWNYFPSATDAVEKLHRDGYKVFAVEQCEGSMMLDRIGTVVTENDNKERYAVILGNEVHGVHQEVIDLCDGCIEIPQFGTKHSLNVSVTGGIIIWEFARRIML